jgi:hypothetical protein
VAGWLGWVAGGRASQGRRQLVPRAIIRGAKQAQKTSGAPCKRQADRSLTQATINSLRFPLLASPHRAPTRHLSLIYMGARTRRRAMFWHGRRHKVSATRSIDQTRFNASGRGICADDVTARSPHTEAFVLQKSDSTARK